MSDTRPPPPPPHPFARAIPEGDDRERLVCGECGFVLYDNPKIVVGSVVRWEDKILMCRRAINPRRGFWTLPAGYLELNESTQAGAAREAWEEARAKIMIETLLAIYDIPRISQVQLIYRARLIFGWDEIPWDEIAFPSVHWALGHEKDVRASGDLTPRSTPLDPAAPPANPAAPQGL
jgi:ADP-ribose pyrophosphatase YjhB (NUDIX family)